MKRPIFQKGNLYHIYNRGVDKRAIFLDDKDRFRFIHNLWEFNDTAPADNYHYKMPLHEVRLREMPRAHKKERVPRTLLVKLHVFCLMNNHFHLLMEPFVDGGITEFMRKIGTGYTNYFNQKYQRSGVLFQGKFKAIMLENESHFLHIPYYIHCNPLDYKFHSWRNRSIVNSAEAMKFLENYRWSSLPDYLGKRNFPSVTQRDFLTEFLGNTDWSTAMRRWLESQDQEIFEQYTLE